MTFMVNVLRGRDIFNPDVERGFFVTKRDPTTGTWEDTEIWVNDWILGDEIADLSQLWRLETTLLLLIPPILRCTREQTIVGTRVLAHGAFFRMRAEGLVLHSPNCIGVLDRPQLASK